MASRTKRIDLKDIPGARENQVRWMMASGVRTAADARKAAAVFISHVKEIRSKASARKKSR